MPFYRRLSFEKVGSAIHFTHNGTIYHLSTVDMEFDIMVSIFDNNFSYRIVHCPYTGEDKFTISVQIDTEYGPRTKIYHAHIYDHDMDADVDDEEFTKDDLIEMIKNLRSKVKEQEEEIIAQEQEIKTLKDTIAENDHNDLVSSLAPDLIDR